MKPEECAAALGAPLIFPAAVERGETLGPGSCRHHGVKTLGEGLRAGTAGCRPQLRGTAERAGWAQELGEVLLPMLLPPGEGILFSYFPALSELLLRDFPEQEECYGIFRHIVYRSNSPGFSVIPCKLMLFFFFFSSFSAFFLEVTLHWKSARCFKLP